MPLLQQIKYSHETLLPNLLANIAHGLYSLEVSGTYCFVIGTTDALFGIARREGLGALWSGLPPTLVMAVPATVIYFSTYDTVKGIYARNRVRFPRPHLSH